MKNCLLRLSVFLVVLIFFSACSLDKEQKCQLKIAIPFSYTHFFDFDSLSDYNDLVHRYEYDSIKKQRIYVYDSIPEGEITLTFFSLLTNDYKRTIQLNKDTTIVFDTTLYSRFNVYNESVKGYPQSVFNLSLQDLDTIYIGRHYSGCLSSGEEKMKFFKVDTNYSIQITKNFSNEATIEYTMPAKAFEKAFEKYMHDFEEVFYKPEIKIKTSSGKYLVVISYSTYSEDIYLLKGDTIYEFPKVANWYGYSIFKTSIEEANHSFIIDDSNRETEIQKEIWDTILVKQK